jgi:prepilin-type N-terminal cleavage/methylation domain-containing protein
MNRRGFSLIELMLAVAITSIVVAVISLVLVKQSQASVKQTQQRTLEETGRLALLEIAHSVRMAGSGIDPTAAFDFDRYACGTPGTAATCNNNTGRDGTATGPAPRDRIDGSDEIVLSYRDPSFSRNVVSKSGSDPYTLSLDRPLTAAIAKDRIAMLLCSGADPVAYLAFAADAAPDQTIVTLRSVTNNDGYYPKSAPTDTCFGKSSLVLVERVRYFVANDTDKVPSLFRDRGRGGDPTLLFRGIEDLQFTFTIGPPPAGGPAPLACGNGWEYGAEGCPQGTMPRDATLEGKPDFWINDGYDDPERFKVHPANIRSVQISLVARAAQLSPDVSGDALPKLANRPAAPKDPAHPYARSVLTIREHTTNLLARARLMPGDGGG